MSRRSAIQSEGAGVFEKTWERIQIKTFTGWVNSHLTKRGLVCNDLFVDFEDGLKLASLLECLSGDPVPGKFNRNPKISLHKIQNLNFCLKFIAEKGVKLVGISSEEIVEGNQKLILGMVWTLILRFQIQDISVEQMSAKEALLLWCQKKTEGYDGVSVKNFHTSWQDGLALCALIHKHRPDLIDFDSLDKSDAKGNLNKAFDVAEQSLDIPRLLDANDIVDLARPDERSIITYVSLFFHKFSEGQKNEVAARRLAKALDFYQSTNQAKEDYNQRATQLLDWINQTTKRYSERNFDNTLEGVEKQSSEFGNYKKTERPPHAKEKVDLEGLFSGINTKLNLNGRGNFQPVEGLTPKELEDSWKRLEKTEREHNQAIQEELRRQRRIRDAVNRFDNKGRRLENWIDQQQNQLNSAELGDILNVVNANLRNHNFFVSEKDGQNSNLKALHSAYEVLVKENYHDISTLSERLNRIDSKWETLGQTGDSRKVALEERQAKLRKLEDLQEEFSKRAKPIDVWLADSEETLTEPIIVYSSAEANNLVSEVDEIVNKKNERQQELNNLSNIVQELSNENIRADVYSPVTWERLQQRWSELDSLVNDRRQQIQQEVDKQAKFDEYRRDYAEKAKITNEWIKSKNSELTNLSGSAEQQSQFLQKLLQDISNQTEQYNQTQTADELLESEHILENPYTDLDFDNIKYDWASLSLLVRKKQEAIQSELNKESTDGLSSEQTDELKQCFNHFDKDKDGLLERLEFGGALLALGSSISLEERNGELDKIIKRIDKDQDGKINLEEFLSHMKDLQADNDTPDELKEAFRTLAGDRDFITEAQLRSVLPKDKADFCVANMPRKGDGFDFEAFSSSLYA